MPKCKKIEVYYVRKLGDYLKNLIAGKNEFLFSSEIDWKFSTRTTQKVLERALRDPGIIKD